MWTRTFAFSRKSIAFPLETLQSYKTFTFPQETLPFLAKHLHCFGKVLRSLSKLCGFFQNICIFLKKNICVVATNLRFLAKHLQSPAKVFNSPMKLCIFSQNIYILSQKNCVPQWMLHSLEIAFPKEMFSHKTFAFSCKRIAFPSKTWHFLAELLHPLTKVLQCEHNIVWR